MDITRAVPFVVNGYDPQLIDPSLVVNMGRVLVVVAKLKQNAWSFTILWGLENNEILWHRGSMLINHPKLTGTDWRNINSWLPNEKERIPGLMISLRIATLILEGKDVYGGILMDTLFIWEPDLAKDRQTFTAKILAEEGFRFHFSNPYSGIKSLVIPITD